MLIEPSESDVQELPDEYVRPPAAYRNSTYVIVSKIAYLIGVPRRIFENEHQPPRLDIYEALEQNKYARIIRNLCRLRTDIESNFKHINDGMTYDLKNLNTMPEYVSAESLRQLQEDGISIVKTNYRPVKYIIDINRLISDRINNCKELFPIWLNWLYIRDLFIMPDGLTEPGTARAAGVYYANKSHYPYSVYINWAPADEGNILYCDKKFVSLLYRWHNDTFVDLSKVSDVGDGTKGSIYEYLLDSEKCVIVVDCENSDPYKLCATLRNLDPTALDRISKIILYDDVHSSSAWGILDTFVKIPIDHILIERLKQSKSLVDIRLTTGVCQEYYKNDVDAFIIVSSDSDYWGLITSLPDARFLVMVEREKCGPDMKAALQNSGIFFCYLDDFYSGDSIDIKIIALLRELYRYLEENVRLNVHDMLEDAYRTTRVEMSEAEKQQFYYKYIRPMHLVIADDGTVSIELKGN